jgi:hypothetical protein
MGTLNDVSSILDSSPLAGRYNADQAKELSVDLTQIGDYLAKLVDELRVLHEAVLQLAERVDEIAA